jgi:phospholipid/cholesterol/gamma-HCH transport system substrate-binding protein
MRESPNKRAVVVGLFVFVGLIFLASGILMVGNLHDTFKRKITIISYFEDVNGLQAGNNIWFSGVKVGTVKDIHFHSRSAVEVTMRIDVKTREYIHKDAKVKLSTDGLIGNKILVIYGGTGEFEQIQEADTLEVEKAVSQEEVLKILQESNKNLLSITTDFKSISRKVAAGEGTVGKLLNDDALYDNANNAIRSIQQMSSKGHQLLNNLNRYTAQLNKEGTLANDLVTDTVVFNSIREFAQRLKQIADTTAMLVTQLKTISSDSTTSIGVLLHNKETGANLKETLKNLESSSKKLDEDLEAAQHSWPLKKGFKKMEKDSLKNKPK